MKYLLFRSRSLRIKERLARALSDSHKPHSWSAGSLFLFLLFCCFTTGAVFPLFAQEAEPDQEVFILELEEELIPESVHRSVESMVFDLYLSDSLQGLILLDYTEEWFEIIEPLEVLEQIEELENGEEILPLLEGRIYGEREIEGIGSVIYDLYTFRLILNLETKYLPSTEISLSGRLPDPDSKFSLQQSLGVAASGTLDDSDYNSSFTHRTIASAGKLFGYLDGTVVRDQDYVLTRGSVGGFVDEYEFGAGLLQTQGQSFASSAEFVGLQFETSEDLILDRDYLRGSRLEIFVPSRSRVEFFRAGRLLSVQILDFGLQEVDTRNFPQGSYDVEVVIREDNGRVTQEQQFFTKTGFLSLRDTPFFSVQAGVLRNQLDVVSKPVFQGDLRMRAGGSVELRGSITGTDSLAIGSVEALSVYREYLMSLSGSLSNEGNSGVSSTLSGEIFETYFSVRHNQTLNTDSSRVVSEEDLRRLSEQDLLEQRLNSISRRRSSTSASISKNLGTVTLRFLANRNKRDEQDILLVEQGDDLIETALTTDRYAYGPKVEWRIFSDQRGDLRLDASYLRTNDGYTALANLLYRFRSEGNTSFNSRLRLARTEDRGNEVALLNTLGYDSVKRTGLGTRASISNEVIGTEDSQDDLQMISQFNFDRRGDLLRTDLFVRDNRFGVEDTTSAGLNAETSFLISEKGNIDISSPPQTESVLIAELASSSTTSDIEILVDGQVYDKLPAGSRSVIGVSPFRTYAVGIRPTQEADLVNYDARIHQLTFFPGNIVRQSWSVEKVFIALGRVLDEFGQPIAYQRIQGTPDYSITEEDGSFQIEITGLEDLSIQSKYYNCALNLEMPEEDIEFFYDFGDLVCSD